MSNTYSEMGQFLQEAFSVEKTNHKTLTEKVNHENDEINALLRQYVGKKNIPAKAAKAIEAAGITINRDKYNNTIAFIGPHGKKLSAYGRVTKNGPNPPQTDYERRNFSKGGGYGRTQWDLSTTGDGDPYDRDHLSSEEAKKSWNAADLKGYLDSDRPKMSFEDRKATVDPSYSPRAVYADQMDLNLRPHSDPYRWLKDKEENALWTRDHRRGWYDIKSDDEIEAEVQAFRDKLVAKNNRNKTYNQEAEDEASSASKAVDDYLKSKGIRESLNESYNIPDTFDTLTGLIDEHDVFTELVQWLPFETLDEFASDVLRELDLDGDLE